MAGLYDPSVTAAIDTSGDTTFTGDVSGDVVMKIKDTGVDMLPSPVVANQTAPGIPVLHEITVPDAATGDVDVVLDQKTRILDVWLVKTGGAGGSGDTITVKNGSTAITDAMDINVADKVVVRAGTIDDAQQEIAAAGTLKVTRTKGSANNAACKVYVLAVRAA